MLRNQHYFFTIKVEHWRSGAESKAQLPIVWCIRFNGT